MAGPKYDPFTRRTYGLSLRVWTPYNQSMQGWLEGIPKERDGGVVGTIPVIMSTPERAFARRRAPLNEGRPDIPMISFYMASFDYDFDRVNGFVPSHQTYELVRVPGTDRVRRVPKMLPVSINYMATLWAKHLYQVQIADWDLGSRMRPHSYINTYGADCPVYFESASDSSDLEPGSAGDRQIRRDYSFRVEGWMPLPYVEEDRLEKITIGITDDESAGDEPYGADDELDPEWELPTSAFGGVLVRQRMKEATGASALQSVPEVETWEKAQSIPSGPNGAEIGEASIRLPGGVATRDRGRVAFVFDITNLPPWTPTPGSPVLIWQPRDDTNPTGDRYGAAYLYRKIRVVGGYEFHGVAPDGRFVEPARLTSDGVTLFEAERVETML